MGVDNILYSLNDLVLANFAEEVNFWDRFDS
jgi:hypothetical protein